MDIPAGGTIQAMAAATESGAFGACLFTLDARGSLSFRAQQEPGGYWQLWQGPSFGGQPRPGAALACAGQNVGRLMLAMLDRDGKTWTLSQKQASGDWHGWQGPGIGAQPSPWSAIAAGQLSGPRGLQLIATDAQGQIWSCYQMNPGADWSGWTTGLANLAGGQPAAASEVALAGQGDGRLILFALAGGQVAALPQAQPGGSWGGWSAPGLAGQAVDLHGLCACTEGGGARLWALDGAGQVWTVGQAGAGGGWGGWAGPGFERQPEPFVRIAAADQNNGCAVLLGVDERGRLHAVAQLAAGGGWGGWRELSAPAPT